MSSEQSKQPNPGSRFLTFWNKGEYIIINKLSDYILDSIDQYGSQIEIFFIIILIYFIWTIIDYILNEYVFKIQTISENDQWKSVLLKLSGFINTALLFLVISVVFKNVFSIVKISDFNIYETFVFILSKLLLLFCFIDKLQVLLFTEIKS